MSSSRSGLGWVRLLAVAGGLVPLGLSLPSPAAAQDEARILAEVLLTDPLSYEGGSLIGPAESRATWYSFGQIQPVHGSAMLAFSTGDADGSPLPGTDLGVTNAGDDRAGMNLSLRVPEGIRSMRLSYRVVAPAEVDEDSLEDVAHLLLQGESVGLDPWTLAPVGPTSAGLQDSLVLSGTRFESPTGLATPWTEVAVPVVEGLQLLVTLAVADDPASDLGDFLLLLDRLSFDRGIPEGGGIRPGRIPLISSASPTRVAPQAAAELVLSGRDLPPVADIELVLEEESSGDLVVLYADDLSRPSSEHLQVQLPPLEEGQWGVRLTWDGGSLFWPTLFEVSHQVPRLLGMYPDVGSPEGGGLALIEGLGFDEVSSLRWNDTPVTTFDVVSPEQIELVVPPGEPGPVDVSLFAGGGYAEVPGLYRYSDPGDALPSPENTSPPARLSSCAQAGSPTDAPARSLLLILSLFLLRRRRASPG